MVTAFEVLVGKVLNKHFDDGVGDLDHATRHKAALGVNVDGLTIEAIQALWYLNTGAHLHAQLRLANTRSSTNLGDLAKRDTASQDGVETVGECFDIASLLLFLASKHFVHADGFDRVVHGERVVQVIRLVPSESKVY